MASSVRDGIGEPRGPNAGRPVWAVQVDTTETVRDPSWQAHYWIEVNKATGVPTLTAYG
jgi:hypothetical protein